MKALLLALVLVACGGNVTTGTECASADYARACSAGGVIVFDGTPEHGTMSTCVHECPTGQACTFDSPSGFVDGACR